MASFRMWLFHGIRHGIQCMPVCKYQLVRSRYNTNIPIVKNGVNLPITPDPTPSGDMVPAPLHCIYLEVDIARSN